MPSNSPLSATAKTFIPGPDDQAKAKALADKIAAYEAEIRRLKNARAAAEKGRTNAQTAKDKLSAIDEKLLKYFTYIENNCSDFLKISREANNFLFRGQDDSSLPIFVGYPRSDRKPKDSSKEASELLDKSLTLLGFKALRSNSIFTSSDQYQASGYGDVYAIFPKNGFSFTWSTEHDDLVIHSKNELTGGKGGDDAEDVFYNLNEYQSDELEYMFDSDNLDETIADMLDTDYHDKKVAAYRKTLTVSPEFKTLHKLANKWHNGLNLYSASVADVHKAFVSLVDALVVFADKFPKFAKSIKLCPASTVNKAKKLKEKLSSKGGDSDLELAKRIVKVNGFTHADLKSALKSGHEICILGEYVAVDFGLYEEELTKFFAEKKTAKKKAPPSKVSDEDYDEDDDAGW